MTRVAFWSAAALIAWTYVGFPLVLLLRAWLRPRPHREAGITPSVTVVVAAHDEEAVIGDKLASVAALDYPADHVQVIVASDGSTDATEAIVAAAATADPRIELLALPRLGKASAMNEAIARARGSIIVFTDANSLLDRDALRALVRPFADTEVGAVAGDQRYTTDVGDGAVGDAERRYWDLDRALKVAGSRAGNATSATGALHAIRRELVDAVPDGVTDDFFLSTGAIVRGRRLVFAPDAVTREPVAASAAAEFDRKVRVISRGLRAVRARRTLLSPRRGFYALQLLTHKVLRRVVVVPLVVLAAASAVGAASDPILRWAAAGQAVGYGAAVLGGLTLAAGRRPPAALRFPTYLCLVNVAAAVALWRTLRGRAPVVWQPERVPDTPDAAVPRT